MNPKNIFATGLLGVLISNCAGFPKVPTPTAHMSCADNLYFVPTPFFQQHPEVADELCSFLAIQEVQDALGFNPTHYTLPIVIEPGPILMDYGSHFDGRITLNALLFDNGFQERYLPQWQGYNQVMFSRELAKYKDLTADAELQQLHARLIFTHELAHVHDYYHPGSGLDTHDLGTRMETRVLENLHHAGRVSDKLYLMEKEFLKKHYQN